MAKLPRPRLPLPPLSADDLTEVEAGTLVWRIYRVGGKHPAGWGSFRFHGPLAVGRFDHQIPPAHNDAGRGILYGALEGHTAVVEAFQDSRVIDRFRDSPWLVAFELELDVVALDLRGVWPTKAGASQAISSGRRDIAQGWSREIFGAYANAQALVYPSAMAGGAAVNIAMYERARNAIPPRPTLHVPLAHPGLEANLNRIAAKYGYGMV